MPDYDLVVIGSGPAGEKGAAQAAYFGKKVALVERESDLGGAAANTGTLPSKTLRETSLYLSGFRQRGLYGVEMRARGAGRRSASFSSASGAVAHEEQVRIGAEPPRARRRRVPGQGRGCVDPHTVLVRRPGSARTA